MAHNTTGPVVVGVDFSAPSQTAIDYGAWQAEQQHRELHLIHGYDELAWVGVPAVTGYDTAVITRPRPSSPSCARRWAPHIPTWW